MSRTPSGSSRRAPDPGPRDPFTSPALKALGVLLMLEGVAMGVVTVLLLVSIATERSTSISSSIALAVCAALAAVLLVVTGRSALRAAKWIRPATLVWQLIVVLVGLYAFQGPQARPDIGLGLVVPGILGIVLLFTPSVTAATRRN